MVKDAFCCECGRPVPTDNGIIGHCSMHPNAKRYRKTWAQKQFSAMRAAIADACKVSPAPRPSVPYVWPSVRVEVAA